MAHIINYYIVTVINSFYTICNIILSTITFIIICIMKLLKTHTLLGDCFLANIGNDEALGSTSNHLLHVFELNDKKQIAAI